jgi:N-acetylglutamate synthase-like GNAT family acetyltransferase
MEARMVTQRDEFIPGTVWTPELIRQSIDRMLAALSSPEMQQAMDAAAHDAGAGESGSISEPARALQQRTASPVDPTRCVFRRARQSDVPRIAEMMIAEDLPPLFIDEWLPGFVVVEHDDEVIGCGGGEIYDDCCVIRSIAVDARARKLGIARTITDLLIADARAAEVTDAYLFTVDAYPFWLRLGFADVPLEEWKLPPRQGWQYGYVSTHPGAVEGIHSMWKRIDG